MKVLALNAGSNSLKFVVAEVDGREPGSPGFRFGRYLVSGSYDNIGKEEGVFTLYEGKKITHQEDIFVKDYADAARLCLRWIAEAKAADRNVSSLEAIERIGHRVVHGAHLFSEPALIDGSVVQKIQSLSDLAPIHNEAALSVIQVARAQVPESLPMVAVFDTVFHQTLPNEAALYPLPLAISAEFKIRRYGFHGISHRYMMIRYGQIIRRPVDELTVITLHLEGGSSATAIRHGQSVDTSMGLTPLEGLMMGTRCGDIDPAIFPYLMRKQSRDAKEVETFLNKQCGLLGVSGRSADTRELIRHRDQHQVQLALDMFSYRVRKYIGAYLAALGETQAIVFGGGIGENTPLIREGICTNLQALGVVLDKQRNDETIDREGLISTDESPIQLWVIPTEEALMVAHEAAHIKL